MQTLQRFLSISVKFVANLVDNEPHPTKWQR